MGRTDFEAESHTRLRCILERTSGTVLGFVALASIYLVRMQAVAHSDGPKLFASDGEPGAIHFLFAPTLALWRKACSWLWLSDQYVATALSCVSTAFAVVCLFEATRRFEGRRVALATALLAASAPAVFFYATTIEIHATFFAVFGLVALATSAWLARPTIGRGALVGMLCGFGYWMHNTGALLPIVPVSMLIAREGRRAAPPTVAAVIALVVVHVVVAAVGHFAFVPADAPQVPDGMFLRSLAGCSSRPLALFLVAWREWFWAFFPIALVFPIAWLVPRQRWLATSLVMMLVPYLCATFILMAGYSPDEPVLYEKGAYLLPLVWPCAWAVAASGSRLLVGVLFVASIVSAQFHVYWGVDHRRNLEFAAGLDEVRAGAPAFVLIGDWHDWEACLFAEPRIEHRFVVDLGLWDPANQSALLPLVAREFRGRIERGDALFVTEAAIRYLRRSDAKGITTAGALLGWFESEFVMHEVEWRGFRGYRVLGRP